MGIVEIIMIAGYIAAAIAVTLMFNVFYNDGWKDEPDPERVLSTPLTVLGILLILPYAGFAALIGVIGYRVIDRERQQLYRQLYMMNRTKEMDHMRGVLDSQRRERIAELERELKMGV